MLFQKGKTQERVQELTSLCERQQSELVEAAQRARELQRLASAAKKSERLAEDQVRKMFGRGSPGGVGVELLVRDHPSIHVDSPCHDCSRRQGAGVHISTRIIQLRHRREVSLLHQRQAESHCGESAGSNFDDDFGLTPDFSLRSRPRQQS